MAAPNVKQTIVGRPGPAGPPTIPGGSPNQVQFCASGAPNTFGASQYFTFNPTLPAWTMGTNATASAKNSVAIGEVSTASGEGAFCHSSLGLVSVASNSRCVNLGAENTATSFGSINVGHLNTVNATDAMTVGENILINSAAANGFGSGFGTFILTAGIGATVQGYGSICQSDFTHATGLNATADHPGCYARSSGCQGTQGNFFQGYKLIDLAVTLQTGGTGKLLDVNGGVFNLLANSVMIIRATVLAFTKNAAKLAWETWMLTVTNVGGTTTLVGTKNLIKSGTNGFADNAGWSLAWSAPGGAELALNVTVPGGDHVCAFAQYQWSEPTNIGLLVA